MQRVCVRAERLDQVTVREIRTRRHRRHTPAHLIDPVRVRQNACDFEEHPMPESSATFGGSMFISKHTSTIAALIESSPHSAHSVESEPS